MPHLYIIAGCNGSGKTTASFTILPEMLNVDVFINADEIAKGLSPLNPEKASIEAGRLMLTKIDKLIADKHDFAFETTLATRSYASKIAKAREAGYIATLLFLWLDSPELATERVKTRVSEGGHDVKEHVILRRYFAGVKNLFDLYIPVADYWMIFNSSGMKSELIAEGYTDKEIDVKNNIIFDTLKKLWKNDE